MKLFKKELIIREKQLYKSYTMINGVFKSSYYRFKRLHRDLSPKEAICPCRDCSMSCTGHVRSLCTKLNSYICQDTTYIGYRFFDSK